MNLLSKLLLIAKILLSNKHADLGRAVAAVRSPLCITWDKGWVLWAGTCGHRGLTYDSIFGLAHHQLFA
jgi:hypothetical protein